ncbi:hypothetical protein [Tranquillimonas alkanivorans]|uniref:Uncharacterized protein n=1 Tax=Tranquillimonas alkanivorans TaxID=441119 RepID=A0A1I5UYX7_9RHOB|nr:hypothetical protein [Tranquillimonas alkanivorans]SFQ00430.1 hypothetical protein SAMN04488047_12529 [Tranquillimonas alkanivorans]
MTDYTPGDVVEVRIGDQLAYVQVTHNHPSYPPVVRAFGGLHEKRPEDLDALAAGPTHFVAMIPLGSALRHVGAEHELVARVQVPDEQKKFPTFRMPIRDKKGEIVYWWFWDGQGLSYDVELDDEQKALPLREVTSGARFLEMLSSEDA